MPPSAPAGPAPRGGAPRLHEIPKSVLAAGAFSIVAGALLLATSVPLGILLTRHFGSLAHGALILDAGVCLALLVGGHAELSGRPGGRWAAVLGNLGAILLGFWSAALDASAWMFGLPAWTMPVLAPALLAGHAAAILAFVLPPARRFFAPRQRDAPPSGNRGA